MFVTISEFDTQAELVVLDNVDFDVIYVMDQLSKYYMVLDYVSKTVTYDMLSIPLIIWQGSFSCESMEIISYIWDMKLLSIG